jgi:hypothetical protein
MIFRMVQDEQRRPNLHNFYVTIADHFFLACASLTIFSAQSLFEFEFVFFVSPRICPNVLG